MLQTVSRLLPELPLFLVTAVATHICADADALQARPLLSPSATTSTSITPTIPNIILSHGRTSVTKATIRPSSSFLCVS